MLLFCPYLHRIVDGGSHLRLEVLDLNSRITHPRQCIVSALHEVSLFRAWCATKRTARLTKSFS